VSTLKAYRRHNKKCSATEGNATCSNKRRGCPIWVRGVAPGGEYIERSLKDNGKILRDYNKALTIIANWETNGTAPKADDARTTIEQWRDQFLTTAKANNLEPSTIRKYETMFRQIMVFAANVGLLYVSDFTKERTQAMYEEWSRAKHQKTGKVLNNWNTMGKKLERLRNALQYAVDRDWLIKNPSAILKAPKKPKAKTVHDDQKHPFTTDEMVRILTAAKPNPRVYAFILTLRATGLRISDVTKLAVTEVSGNSFNLIQQKTGEPVQGEMNSEVVKMLNEVLLLNSNKAYYFQTGNASIECATDIWRRKLIKVFQSAGVKGDYKPHRLRHTYATESILAGVKLEDVSKALGHASEDVTRKHYSHWVKERQKQLDIKMLPARDTVKDLLALTESARPN
jgi:integrase